MQQVDPTITFPSVESVGPTVSGELVQTAILAVTLAIAAVLIYIWLRFEWQFSLGAVVALIHDVTLTIGIFCLLQIRFDLAIIAALLTIVGYSLNDTVIVFDRVRENLRKFKKRPLKEVLNLSINDTLSRTVMTSFTTLIALIALFVLGGDVIRGFVFAMIWASWWAPTARSSWPRPSCCALASRGTGPRPMAARAEPNSPISMPDILATALATSGLVWLLLTIAAAGIVRGFTGFGTALIFVPVAGIFLEPQIVIALITLTGVASTAALLPRAWGQADRREVGTMGLAALVTVPLGLWLLTLLDREAVRWIVAGVAAVTLTALIAGWRYRGKVAMPGLLGIGAAAGGIGGLTGADGPRGDPVLSGRSKRRRLGARQHDPVSGHAGRGRGGQPAAARIRGLWRHDTGTDPVPALFPDLAGGAGIV